MGFAIPRGSMSRTYDGRRFQKGDSVVVSMMTENPPTSLVEADVINCAYDQLVVRFRCGQRWQKLTSSMQNQQQQYQAASHDPYQQYRQRQSSRQVQFRVDRMGNRISHNRHLRAIGILCGASSKGSSKLGEEKPHPALLDVLLSPFNQELPLNVM